MFELARTTSSGFVCSENSTLRKHKVSTIFVLYQRQPVLPIELKTDEEAIEKFSLNNEEATVENVICTEFDNMPLILNNLKKCWFLPQQWGRHLKITRQVHYYFSSLPEERVDAALSIPIKHRDFKGLEGATVQKYLEKTHHVRNPQH